MGSLADLFAADAAVDVASGAGFELDAGLDASEQQALSAVLPARPTTQLLSSPEALAVRRGVEGLDGASAAVGAAAREKRLQLLSQATLLVRQTHEEVAALAAWVRLAYESRMPELGALAPVSMRVG